MQKNDCCRLAAGAVAPLINLLHHSSTKVLEKACYVLSRLACTSDEIRGEIIAYGSLPPLVRLKQHSSAYVADRATQALKNLANNSDDINLQINAVESRLISQAASAAATDSHNL